ncbi:MAG: shikimate dehydrogenase [Candidatus Hydrogenedentes bacterium]|nr:shikimate dehydrogenase [Candidatus Hydrogenedentota bacterium]
MPRIDTATKLCAVIGAPVGHSLSPAMHNAAFEAAGLNYVYVAFHVDDVGACLTGMRALRSFRGMSVTIPHKVAVMPFLDEIDPMAVKVGCVNTIVNHDGRLAGSTTDGLGTLKAFADAGVDLRGKRVLFLGAGGAVRSVAFAFADMAEAAHITILGRDAGKVAALVRDLPAKTRVSVAGGDLAGDLAQAMAAHDVVAQGTPVGMYPHPDATCVPKELLRPDHVVFDMVYRPLKTRFVKDAEESGCKTILGVEMLVNQAALQFETWTGETAPYAVMREALLAELNTD